MPKPRPRVSRSESLTRRRFLANSLCAATVAQLPSALSLIGAPVAADQKFRAAIIGDTGHGDYGHEHELIFTDRENITVVALADPYPAGRAKAAKRAKALRQYADYREMLEKEKPQLVSIAPRWTDQHHAMALAALRIGAHVYLEKPITQTLAEADEMLAIAQQNGTKIVVAHQMRLAPNILLLKKYLDDGGLGELLEIRSQGKQDHRAGGEDMIVLGVHIFDLMRFFAGEPAWCSARVLQNGHEITLPDARAVTENIGPVAGDEIFAQFAFAQGVNARFTSRANNRETSGPMGLELVGSKGTIKVLLSIMPTIWERKSGAWTKQGQVNEWLPWKGDPTLTFSEAEKSVAAANRRVVDDWLAAIAENREPVCSGNAGMKALEMAMAVFAAGLSRERVYFPLKERKHPLRA